MFTGAVNSDTDIQKTLENVVLYQVDSEKGEGKTLADSFRVKYYPTFVMTSARGEPLDRWLGYDKESFIQTMSSATADPATIDDKLARLKSSPDARTAEALGRYYSALLDFKNAVEYYRQAQSLKTDPKADYSYDIFDNMAQGAEGGLFPFEEISQAADAAIISSKDDPHGIVGISSRMARIANKNKRPNDVAKFLQIGLDATAGKDDAILKRIHNELMVDFSLMVKNDTASAVEYKKATMPVGWLKDPNMLNEFAWWCFENNANLNEAEKLSRRSVELAKPGRDKAGNLDTLAEIMHAKGNTREAVELSKKAAKESPDSKYFPQQVERFEKLLKEKQGS